MPHFGRYDMALTQCSHYPEDPPFGHSEGTTTFVAANGDKLVLAHTIEWETILNDVGDDDGFEGVGTWTVHDHESTGRFASARATGSGSITMIGDIPVDDTPHHDLPAGATLWTFDGEIEYRASDRSGK
jgi:hypothetical protein